MGRIHYVEMIKRIEENYYHKDHLTNFFNILFDLDITSISKYQDEMILNDGIENLFDYEVIDAIEIFQFINNSGPEFARQIVSLFNFTSIDYLFNLFINETRKIVNGYEVNITEIEDYTDIEIGIFLIDIIHEWRMSVDEQNYHFIYDLIKNDDVATMDYYINNNKINKLFKDYYNNSLLHLAAHNNSLKLIEYLLKIGLDVNEYNDYHLTPLLNACTNFQHFHHEAISLLIELNADIYKADYSGNTIIHYICSNGYTDLLNILLSQNINMNIKNKNNHTPLEVAIMRDQVEIVKIIFNSQLLKMNKEMKYFLLCLSVESHSINVFNYFADNKFNIHQKSNRNETLLHFAARSNNNDIASLLINKGFNINSITKDQLSVLDYAIINKHVSMIKLLIESGANINRDKNVRASSLSYAVRNSTLEIIKLLVESGANVNNTVKSFTNPLTEAVKIGSNEISTYLLEHGADVNGLSLLKKTPLHIAVEKNNLELVKLLISYGANVDAKKSFGYTALDLAIKNKFHTIIDELIKAGVNVNINRFFVFSYLHKALDNNDNDLVLKLVNAGAYIDTKNFLKQTPMDVARINKNEEARKIMINYGKKNIVKELKEIDYDSLIQDEEKIKRLKRNTSGIHQTKSRIHIGTILCFIISIFFLWTGSTLAYNSYQLHTNGEKVYGIITDKRNKEDDYSIKYQFEIDQKIYYKSDGLTGQGNHWYDIGEQDYEQLTLHSPIFIKYNKDNPTNNYPLFDSTNENVEFIKAILMDLAVVLIGIIALGAGIKTIKNLNYVKKIQKL